MPHICQKIQEIEQLKIDLAVAKSDIATVKLEISGIKTGISKGNLYLISIMFTTIGSLILMIMKIKGIG